MSDHSREDISRLPPEPVFSLAPLPDTEAEWILPPVLPKVPIELLMAIPTYNESENIVGIIDRVVTLGPGIGVLVVDDNSPDGTSEIVRKYQENHVAHVYLLTRLTNRGRGPAGIDGYRQALHMNVPVIGEMDADGSHAPEDLPAMMKYMREGASGVIGSRLVPGGREEGRSPLRTLLTRAANLYIRMVLGLSVRDSTSGFRMFRREMLADIPWDRLISRGPSLLQEMLLIMHRAGWIFVESPIVFRDRVLGSSTLNGKILANSLRIVLRFRRIYGSARNPPRISRTRSDASESLQGGRPS
jgi:dolichol-phosphate mannosyltransferase